MGGIVVSGSAAFDTAGSLGAAALARAVSRAALRDAELDPRRLTAVFVGAGAGPDPSQAAVAARLALRGLGLGLGNGTSGTRGEPPGEHLAASAAEALHMACHAVRVEADDAVLCLGIDAAPRPERSSAALARRGALRARRILNRLGGTQDDLAQIVVKNRRHGAARGIARATTVPEVLHDEPLDWPLTRSMMAPGGTGAAALVLTAAGAPSRGRQGPRIRAATVGAAPVDGNREAVRTLAARAYREAGVAAEEVDCAEVHDATAADELAAYEDLGWASDGRAADLAASGFTALGGILPVNPSGGLLCLGVRPGCGAIAQVAALARQLGGRAGSGQVEGARAAVALGAGAASHGATELVTVTILAA